MKSNVTVPSNVYILESKIALTDFQFLKQVRGYSAVKKIANNYSEGRLTELQKLILKTQERCDENKNSVVFGLVKERDTYLKKCRCENKDCRYLDDCLSYSHFELLNEERWANNIEMSTKLLEEDELDKAVGQLYDELLGALK